MSDRKKGPPKVLKPSTLGSRLTTLRANADMTQAELAKAVTNAKRAMGIDPKRGSRSAIAQYERDASMPGLDTIEVMAKLFNTTPEFLAFGVKPQGEEGPNQPAYVNEVVFGTAPSERSPVARWGFARQWLEEIGAARPEDIIFYKLQFPQVEGYEHNDRVIVDTSATKITPPGVFLHWDGVGPTISHISVAHGAPGRKLMARVRTKDEAYETEVEKLSVIGRVLVAVKGR